MATTPTTTRANVQPVFPSAALEAVLRKALIRFRDSTAGMREPWEPVFDSLAVVELLSCIEGLVPGVKIKAAQLVRKGGYSTIDNAVNDIIGRIRPKWEKRYK